MGLKSFITMNLTCSFLVLKRGYWEVQNQPRLAPSVQGQPGRRGLGLRGHGAVTRQASWGPVSSVNWKEVPIFKGPERA